MKVSLLEPDDHAWSQHLEKVPHDFYHLPEYLRVSGKFEHGKPHAVLVEDGPNSLFVPFLLRQLPHHLGESGYQDACSPYGYPSPIMTVENNSVSVGQSLLAAFEKFCIDQNIVSFFSRFHPLLPIPDEYFDQCGKLTVHGPTVYIDLSLSEEVLNSQIRKAFGKVIRQAIRKGYQTRFAGKESLPTFCRLYRGTMERLQASDYYFFSDQYFEALFDSMGDSLRLFMVSDENGKDVSASLIGCCGNFIQMHLMGSDETCISPSPNKLLYYAVTMWAKENGYRFNHLGGGFGAQEDNLFHFKKGFSPFTVPYKTWRCIFLPKVYGDLCERAAPMQSVSQTFFPLYRAAI